MRACGDAKRSLNPNYFVDLWKITLQSYYDSGVTTVVCDDVYYINELRACLNFPDKDLTLINVYRQGREPTSQEMEFGSVREASIIQNTYKSHIDRLIERNINYSECETVDISYLNAIRSFLSDDDMKTLENTKTKFIINNQDDLATYRFNLYAKFFLRPL